MEIKTITQGRDGCKVSGAYKLIFPIRKDYYHIRNDGTETAYASVFTDSIDTSEDGVYDIPSGGTLCIRSHGSDTLYVSGEVTVMGTASAVCPFKFAQRGGDTPTPTPTSGGKIELTPLYDGDIPTSGSSVVEITITADTDILQICPKCLGTNGSTTGYVQTVCVPISKLSAEEMQLTVYSYISSTSRMGNFLVSLEGNKVKIRASHTWLNYATIYGQRIVEPNYNAQPDYLIQYGMVSSSSDSVDITFPHAYFDIPVVTAVARGSTASAVAVDNVSQTGFTAVGGNVNWTAVAMIPQVTITSQPQDAEAKIGSTVCFAVTASGTGLTYQWQVSTNGGSTWANTRATGNTTNKITATATEAMNGYKYRCRITDSNGASILSDVAVLTVTEV